MHHTLPLNNLPQPAMNLKNRLTAARTATGYHLLLSDDSEKDMEVELSVLEYVLQLRLKQQYLLPAAMMTPLP